MFNAGALGGRLVLDLREAVYGLLPVERLGEKLDKPLPRANRYEHPVDGHEQGERQQAVVSPFETRQAVAEHEEQVRQDERASDREKHHRQDRPERILPLADIEHGPRLDVPAQDLDALVVDVDGVDDQAPEALSLFEPVGQQQKVDGARDPVQDVHDHHERADSHAHVESKEAPGAERLGRPDGMPHVRQVGLEEAFDPPRALPRPVPKP